MKNAAKLRTQEVARSRLYRRLADVYRWPVSDLPMALKEMESALAQLGSEARDDAASLRASYHGAADTHALAVDHAALFAGPFLVPAPPYGSVYLEDKRQLMGDSTIDARQHYRSLGLDLSPEFKEAPDHISAELEFMHVLIVQSIAAIDAADLRLLTESIGHQRVFLERHLGAWISAFSDKVIEHARTDYYRNLAAVTRTFIAEDMDALPDLPADASEQAMAQT
jgi:putative dimethyl sulfoxide reductase chaperone